MFVSLLLTAGENVHVFSSLAGTAIFPSAPNQVLANLTQTSYSQTALSAYLHILPGEMPPNVSRCMCIFIF